MAKKEIIVILELHCGGRVRIVTVGGDPLMHLTTVLADDAPLPDEPTLLVIKDANYLAHLEDFKDQKLLNCPSFAEEVKEILFKYTDALEPNKSLIYEPSKGTGKMLKSSAEKIALHAPPGSVLPGFYKGNYSDGALKKLYELLDLSGFKNILKTSTKYQNIKKAVFLGKHSKDAADETDTDSENCPDC